MTAIIALRERERAQGKKRGSAGELARGIEGERSGGRGAHAYLHNDYEGRSMELLGNAPIDRPDAAPSEAALYAQNE